MDFLLKYLQPLVSVLALILFALWASHVGAWGLLGYALLGSLPVYAVCAVLLVRKARSRA